MAEQDRSLGTVELHVSELAHESSADPQYRHESTGRKEARDRIRLDGDAYQGQLHYVAEFIPSLAVKNVHFDEDESEIQKAVKDSKELNGDGRISEERSVTATRPIDGAPEKVENVVVNSTTNGASVTDSEPKAEGEEKEESVKDAGVELTKDELLKQRSFDCRYDMRQLTCLQNLELLSSM